MFKMTNSWLIGLIGLIGLIYSNSHLENIIGILYSYNAINQASVLIVFVPGLRRFSVWWTQASPCFVYRKALRNYAEIAWTSRCRILVPWTGHTFDRLVRLKCNCERHNEINLQSSWSFREAAKWEIILGSSLQLESQRLISSCMVAISLALSSRVRFTESRGKFAESRVNAIESRDLSLRADRISWWVSWRRLLARVSMSGARREILTLRSSRVLNSGNVEEEVCCPTSIPSVHSRAIIRVLSTLTRFRSGSWISFLNKV